MQYSRPVIYIIEDDPNMQTILKGNLAIHFEPLSFAEPVEALSFMQQGNIPDLIVCDFTMPGLNGLQFLEQVQCSGFFNTIPIVILSAREDAETRIKCLEAGADDFVLKPFTPRELVARIKNILKRAGTQVLQ